MGWESVEKVMGVSWKLKSAYGLGATDVFDALDVNHFGAKLFARR